MQLCSIIRSLAYAGTPYVGSALVQDAPQATPSVATLVRSLLHPVRQTLMKVRVERLAVLGDGGKIAAKISEAKNDKASNNKRTFF